MEKKSSLLIDGVGLSARPQHFKNLLDQNTQLPWIEVLADNYTFKDSIAYNNLKLLSEVYPVVFHCVSSSIASYDELNFAYLEKIKELIDIFNPIWVSDHLCFVSSDNQYSHDLIPVPYTDENIIRIGARIKTLQEYFERPFLIENVSNYFFYKSSSLSEVDFINGILEEANCDLLLDINNLYVNEKNFGIKNSDFLDKVMKSRVKQIHLAGYSEMDGYLLDTHSKPVYEPVWAYYRQAIEKLGKIPTCIEWDSDIPDFEEILLETRKALKIYEEA